MRHRDYIIDSSVSRKRRLVPSDYMLKLTETLDNLPEVPGESSETKVRVIEHGHNKGMAAWVLMAAACMLAVTGGVTKLLGDSSFKADPATGHDAAPYITSGVSKKNNAVPVTDITVMTSAPVTTGECSVTSVITQSSALVTQAPPADTEIPLIRVTEATRGKGPSVTVNDSEEDMVPEKPVKDKTESDHGNNEPKPEVSAVPEHQKPDPDEQKNENRPAPEKPDPDKEKPEEKPAAPDNRENEKENEKEKEKPSAEPPAPPVKKPSDGEFFPPDNVFAPLKGAAVHESEITPADEHHGHEDAPSADAHIRNESGSEDR